MENTQKTTTQNRPNVPNSDTTRNPNNPNNKPAADSQRVQQDANKAAHKAAKTEQEYDSENLQPFTK